MSAIQEVTLDWFWSLFTMIYVAIVVCNTKNCDILETIYLSLLHHKYLQNS